MSKPNILIFMTDHQRGDTVLPEHPVISPNVAQLAQEGIIFENTFCPSPHCCPARATFHSGLYPPRTGIWNNVCNSQALTTGLKPGVRLWSEDLNEAGYTMEFLGKWHVTFEEEPADRGWHEIFEGSTKGHHHGKYWDHYKELAKQPENTERGEGQILRPGWDDYTLYGTRETGNEHDTKITDQAVAQIRSYSDTDSPWTLFVGCSGPHDPYFVPQRFLDMYSLDDVPLPPSYVDEMNDKPRVYKRLKEQIWGQLSEREVREAVRHFWAYCTFLDELFGTLLKALDETGQADNTLVLYCADHGDYCGDHGLFAKGIGSFRGAYHVPAVIRWPAGIQDPGTRVNSLVSLADFGPTFLEVAGIDTERDFSGASLVPFFKGNTPDDWRDDIMMMCNGVELYYTQRIVMTEKYKYVFNGFDFDELYDLEHDPHEMKNLAHSSEHEGIKRDMVRRMWRSMHKEQDTAINPYITVALAPYGPAEGFR
jgi:arylsulfatase A-like enzyme